MTDVLKIVIINGSNRQRASVCRALRNAGISAQLLEPDDLTAAIAALKNSTSLAEQRLRESEEGQTAHNGITVRQEQERFRQPLATATRLRAPFLTTLSHELRTPLNSVIGYAQMLLRHHYGPLTQEQVAVVERIFTNSQHLLGLIDKMLDLSQPEAASLKFNLEELNLANLIQEIADELRPLAEKKHLALQVHLGLTHPSIVNDRNRLRQILVNLISNAIEFTEAGTIQVAAQELSPHRLALTVRDPGLGIADHDLEHLFDQFWQADRSLKRQHGGLGLGLSAVKALVQAMQGSITVESQLGQGSTFRVELPRYCLPGKR